MGRRAVFAASAVAILLPDAASATVVYQRGESIYYDNPTVVRVRDDGSHARVLAHGWGPTLSPDGRLVAYFKGLSAESLYVKPVKGGPARRLLYGSADTGGRIAWSPDSSLLAVENVHGASSLVDLSGRTRPLTTTGYFDAASFAPSGRRVAVANDPECDCLDDLFAVQVDSLDRRRLGSGFGPVWGRGGLAFARWNQVLVRDRIGARARTVLHNRHGAGAIDWSADGKRLLVMAAVRDGTREYRAVVMRPDHGRPIRIPYAFLRVTDLSKDGREVLGQNLDGELVRVTLDGTARVLAHRGLRGTWTR